MRRVLALVCGSVALAGGCADGDSAEGTERHASAWEQVIRIVALADVAPTPDDDALPVVFAHQSGDDDVPAAVQVEVVNALIDEADVRFADDPDGVIDAEVDDEPVKDDGVLLTMDTPPETGTEAVLEVVRYRTIGDQTRLEVVLSGGGPTWAVEAVTPVD